MKKRKVSEVTLIQAFEKFFKDELVPGYQIEIIASIGPKDPYYRARIFTYGRYKEYAILKELFK